MIKRLSLLLFFFVFLGDVVSAQNECFPKKDENRLVYDAVGVLSDSEQNSLNTRLSEFAASSSNQIVVVIVPDLCGMDKAQYATELGHEWGVGQAKFDNGVVLLVKPTGGRGERHTFIAVGYGLEGAIPDITARHIAEYELIPSFKKNDFYQGISNACNVIIDLASGEYNYQVYEKKKTRGAIIGGIVILLIFGMVIFLFIYRAREYARLNDISFWTALWLISNTGRSHRGTWGGFSGGRGGGGGFGGGGFGGFGGGGFGGGGAGGSW